MSFAATMSSSELARKRSKLKLFASDSFHDWNLTDKGRHPFRHGSHVTKDQVRAFQHPEPELRMNLTTTMWLQMGLDELPISHPMYSALLDRLQSEPPSPLSSTSSPISPATTTQSRICFDQLPAEIRITIFAYSLCESQPISPVFTSSPERKDRSYLNFGLPVLPQEFPRLTGEIGKMLQPFYQSNTFQFDLREDDGVPTLLRWLEEREEEAYAARTISIIHWTWYWSPAVLCWKFVADATILSLTSTGHIKLNRTAGFLDAGTCTCDMETLLSTQCPDWSVNKITTVEEFVKALRQDEELLTQALTKLLDLIQYHDESFHAWRNGPDACTGCGKSRIFLRTFDDVEWTPE